MRTRNVAGQAIRTRLVGSLVGYVSGANTQVVNDAPARDPAASSSTPQRRICCAGSIGNRPGWSARASVSVNFSAEGTRSACVQANLIDTPHAAR